ncbi:hypothetical protein ACQJBY_008360 [Aegilops geniculata]
MTTTLCSQSHNSQPLPIILVLLLLAAAASTRLILQSAAAAAAAAEQDEKQAITLPGCPDRCGDTLIPFPFGTKPGCFREGFQVTCNDSFTPHRAFLAHSGVNQHIAEIYYKVGWHHPVWRTDHGNTALELIDISVADGEARAYGLVSSLCNAANLSGDYVAKCQNLALGERGPFLLSVTRNLLVGVGWRVEPKIMSYLWSAYRNSTYEFSLACLSDLMGMPKLLQLATNGSCSSRGCCQAALPEAAPLTDFGTWFSIEDNPMWQTNPCTYAMVVESDWYRFSTPDLYGVEVLPRRYPRGVPLVLDFSIRNGACPGERPETTAGLRLRQRQQLLRQRDWWCCPWLCLQVLGTLRWQPLHRQWMPRHRRV